MNLKITMAITAAATAVDLFMISSLWDYFSFNQRYGSMLVMR
jgi:hypothetical protein